MADLAASLPLTLLVTDRHLVSNAKALFDTVRAAVDGGINAVQLRERDLPDAEQLELAKGLREVTQGRALLFINDSVSIAEAAHADGVHLADVSRTVADARTRIAGTSLLVGKSVHDMRSAKQAADEGADLMIASNVFESFYDPEFAPAGVGLVRDLVAAFQVPVLGAGGVTGDNAAAVMEAGGAGVAVTRSVLGARDPRDAAERLVAAVRAVSGAKA